MSVTPILPYGSLDNRFQDSEMYCQQANNKQQRTGDYQIPFSGYEQSIISHPIAHRGCDFDWSTELSIQHASTLQDCSSMPAYPDPLSISEQRDAYPSPRSSCVSSTPYTTADDFLETPNTSWIPGTGTCDFQFPQSQLNTFPNYSEQMLFNESLLPTTPGQVGLPAPVDYAPLVFETIDRPRRKRTGSFTSNTSSTPTVAQSDASRSTSPNASEMSRWGYKNTEGSWSCAFQGCTSRSTFNRGCDLRKHYKRHTKSLFCRHQGCPQATEGGFSSKKDRARHEAKHNPNIMCEWDGCGRMFSRVDNMKDHVRRVHRGKIHSQCS